MTAPSATRRSGSGAQSPGSGGAAGVLLGGILTDGLGWEWVLWVNVPVSLVAFALSPRLLAESRGAESEARAFDVAGAVTVTAALSLLVYALVDANSVGWGSTQTIGLILLSVVLMAAFIAIELRASKPLVPFSIFRIRTLTGANVVGLLVGASLFSMFFFISLYMQQVLGYSAIHAGLSYLPLALAIMASAGIASQLVTKLGYKPVLAVGLLFIVVGLAWFSRDLGRRQLPYRHPRALAACRRSASASAFVTTTIAAVSGRRRERGRPRQRPDQHLPAGRRRARPGSALRGGDLRHQRRHLHRLRITASSAP